MSSFHMDDNPMTTGDKWGAFVLCILIMIVGALFSKGIEKLYFTNPNPYSIKPDSSWQTEQRQVTIVATIQTGNNRSGKTLEYQNVIECTDGSRYYLEDCLGSIGDVFIVETCQLDAGEWRYPIALPITTSIQQYEADAIKTLNTKTIE